MPPLTFAGPAARAAKPPPTRATTPAGTVSRHAPRRRCHPRPRRHRHRRGHPRRPPPRKTTWLCKPGQRDNPCTTRLDTARFAPDGRALGIDTPARRSKPQDRLLLRLPDGQRPARAVRDPRRRSRGPLDRALPGLALRRHLPDLRPRLPPGDARRADHRPAARPRAGVPRRPRRLAHVPAAPQPRPRRRPRRPLPGLVRPAPPDPRGDRRQAQRAAPAGLRAAARRQRGGRARPGPGRRLRPRARLPRAPPDRLRRRVLRSTTAPSPTTRRSAAPPTRTARCCARTRPRSAANAAAPIDAIVPARAVRARHRHPLRHRRPRLPVPGEQRDLALLPGRLHRALQRRERRERPAGRARARRARC